MLLAHHERRCEEVIAILARLSPPRAIACRSCTRWRGTARYSARPLAAAAFQPDQLEQRGQIARLLALEQAITAIATSVVGLLFGVALSELIIPADTLTAHATRPIPPVMVQVPWLAAALIAVVMAAVPTLAIMATSPRADSGAAVIRLEGQT